MSGSGLELEDLVAATEDRACMTSGDGSTHMDEHSEQLLDSLLSCQENQTSSFVILPILASKLVNYTANV